MLPMLRPFRPFRPFRTRVRYVSNELEAWDGMGLRFGTSRICCSQECLKRFERSCHLPKSATSQMGHHVNLGQDGQGSALSSGQLL